MWPFQKKGTSVSLLYEIASTLGLTEIDIGRVISEGYADNPVVFAATQRVTTAARTVPWIPQRVGSKDEVTDLDQTHPIVKLLKTPNPWHSWEGIVEHGLGSLILTGHAYVLLNGPGPGDGRFIGPPREALPLPTSWVRVVEDARIGIQGYEVSNGRSHFTVPVDRMVHSFLWNPQNPVQGLSMVRAAARSIDTSNEGRKWNRNLLKNSAKPPGVLGTEKALTDQQFQRIKQEAAEKISGVENAGKPLILEGGLKWTQTGFSPEDMDFLEGLREMKREIAVALGVSPELLGDPAVKTYANAKEARIALYEDTVLPLLRHFAHAWTQKLAKAFNVPDLRLYLDMDAVPAMQERRREYAKTLESLVNVGILTRNEARNELGYDQVDGGDELLVPLSLTPIGSVIDPGQPTEVEDGDEDPIDDDDAGEERSLRVRIHRARNGH